MTKTTKTFSVEEGTYKLFEQHCKKNNINKSSYLESCVKKYLRDNLGYDDEELYYLRENQNYVVSITDRDDTYFELSDGSKIPQILFYQTFKQVEKVDPEKFFNFNRSPVDMMNELGRETYDRDMNLSESIKVKKVKLEEIHPEPQVTKGPPSPPNDRIIKEGEEPQKPKY